MKNLLNKISISYLFKAGTNRLSSLSILTSAGIAIGTAVVIIVMSVMNGFQNELKERILGAVPQITFQNQEGFQDADKLIESIKEHPNVIDAQTFYINQSIISTNSITRGVMLKGTDENEISIIPENMIEGDLETLNQGSNIILGDALAYEIGALPGEKITLIIASNPDNILSIPRTISFLVVGLFSVGSEVDQNYALIGKESFQKAFSLSADSMLEIRLDDVLDVQNTVSDIRRDLNIGPSVQVSTWGEKYGSLFRATQLERLMVSLLMSLILLIAVFSMIISINNFVKDKENEIAMLRTIGYSQTEILRIFLQIIIFLGTLGILFGNLIGVVVSNNITELFNFLAKVFNINVMSTYYVDYFPSIVMFGDILLINGCSFVLIVLLGLIPALKAAKTNPIEILNRK